MLFFTKKTILKDLIPPDYLDFHSHLLFGIDDGAQTFEDTKSLIQAMQGFGTKHFITTPHIMQHVWDNTFDSIMLRKEATNQLLEDQQIPVSLKAAAEYLLDDHFVQLFQKETLLTLKDNYVLVEMSYLNAPLQLYTIIFDLQVAGYKPVLAHPERYIFYHSQFEEYYKLKKAGCLFQLNLLSTVGYYGEGVAKTAQRLLQAGLIDFASSDVHHQRHIAAFDRKVLLKDVKPLQEAMVQNALFL